MPLFGNIVVIKRNGTDGITFPLTASSCLFGRRTECDIRIQLPQVSKEHCKIEVNENKEAILTNLSTVNPTQLNGGCFQQPVPLKHGDVLTIIDRSFRFEYPHPSTPRKRRSRTPKDETLQQVAEVESFHQQPSGPKSPRASDKAEREEKNANEIKQSTEENISKSLPINKLQTPKSSYRIHQSIKKQNEMSPFTKLYEKLKQEMKVKKSLQEGNASQQAAKEDGKRVPLEPSAQISSWSCVIDLGSLMKEKEIGRSDKIEECKITMRPEAMGSELNQSSAVGGATKRSLPRSPRTPVSKKGLRDTGRSLSQGHKEISTAQESKGTEVTPKPSKENDGNAVFLLNQCSIERLGCADRIHSSAIALGKLVQTTKTTNVAEVDKYVLSTPTPTRRSPRSPFTPPTKEISGMNPLNTDTPTTGRRVSLQRKSLSEMSAGSQREASLCRNDSLNQLPLAESKCLKQRRSSKQHTPKAVKEEVLKEICDQANFGNSKEGHPETPVSLSKSSRRSNRRSKELSNRSVCSETLASEELTSELASPAGQKSESGRKRGGRRTSGLLMEKPLETSVRQEDHDKMTDRKDSGAKEELASKGDHQKQDLEDASVIRPQRLSSKRRSSGSPAVLKDKEGVSELKVSGLLPGEDSDKTRRVSQKRKIGDVLPQPLGKRKRVSFGGHLSPELFDKSLPPNSPLKKGAIPARLSLPFGNSPRAVLKKGLKDFAVQELSEHLQKEKTSPKPLPAQKSPTASSPASGKAAPTFTWGSPAPSRRGRFSISHITPPLPIAEEKDAGEEDMDTKEKNGARVRTPKSPRINQDDKTILMATPDKSRRSSQLALKVTPMKRRSGAVAVINAKRRSGASSANLLVAKSWAEVVKLGVARPQSKTVKKHVQKGRSLKKIPKSPKTPERKIKGHVSTGHAKSPATIVVGRAYSTTVRTAGQVPKVVKNPILKLNMNMDESFTGMTEMFQTPENKSGKSLPLAAVQKTDFTPTCSAADISELHTPEESGEMLVSPLNSSDASEQKQDSPGIRHLLRDSEALKSMFDAVSTKTPQKRRATLEKNTSVDHLLIIPEKQACQVKSGSRRRTPKQKLEPVEVMSGVKQLFRTPEQSPEPVEVLSGIKQLMKTPKQKSEPVEVLSGVKQLLRTPKQKPEPVEALSGIKQLMRTPKQKSEPVEALSGIKQLMRTPKQKSEPVEALSGIKQLMRTPKQKSEPVEALSGIKQLMRTPKQKVEPVEALSGIKQLMRTPKQKVEPVEALSGIKQLMRTPKQNPEPVEVLSGIKQLLKTPQQESEPISGEVVVKRLLETPVQNQGAVEDVAGDTVIKQTPKVKYQPVEDMVGVSRIFKTPKERVEPIENMFGFSRLVKTPKEKYQPVDDFVGLQRLMAEPREKCSDFEVDYAGVTEMFDTPEEIKARSVNVTDSKREDTAPPCTNSSQKFEDKGNISQGEDSQQKESASEDQSTQRSTRGRARKMVHPASAKQCEKDLNLKTMQSLEKTSTQEEMREINTSPSVAKNEGRGRRTNRCVQEEIVSKRPGQEKIETVSLVEPCGAPQRTRRGKRKDLKELEHPSENLESCGKDASVLQKELANRKETLQECGIKDVLETEDDPTVKTVSVSSSIQSENYQLQTGIKIPENKSDGGGVEGSEELLLSPGKRARGAKKVENTEPPIPPKRGRRAKNDQIKQAPLEDLQRTTRRLRRDPLVVQGDGPTSDKATETVTAEGAENGTKLDVKVTEKRAKSLRRARKHSAEVEADICGMANEKKTENVQKTEETSAETQSHIAGEIKISQGDETENAQENPTEASQRVKAESPSGETNKMPVPALSLEANRRAVRETNRARNRRGKNGSWEKKADEFAEDVNSLELIAPKLKSETEKDESSLKDSLSSGCVKGHQVTKDQKDPAGASVPAANGNTRARGRPKQTRNQQEILTPNQTEIPQENPAPTNGTAFRRDRGRKVTFDLKEAGSKAVGRKRSLTGDDKGITYKDGPRETSENPALQVRRSRRKQVDSVPQPQTAPSALVENQILVADHSKDEAFVEEQDSALEATPLSAEDNPPRRGRRREGAAASQTSRSLSVRRRRGLLEGEDQKMAGREDQTPASGNKTLQTKANASGRDKRKKIDLAAEAKSSSSLWRKCDSSETGNKEESANEEQNTPLETVSCAKEKPLGRGRRKETALAAHTTNCLSLRGKRGLAADSGREEAPKDDQNVPLETSDLSVKENQQRRGRRKETDVVLEATSSIRGKRGLSKESSGRNNNGEAKKLILENSTSQEKMDLSEGNSMQTITSLALGSTSLQGFPEGGKNKTPEEQQSEVLNLAPSAKENPSRVGRKKTISSKSEETGSTSLMEKPKDRGQKRILKGEGTSLESDSPQEKTRQLRNKKKKVESSSEAATSTSRHKNGVFSGNSEASETQNGCLTSTGSENNDQFGKGKEVTPVQQAPSTSRRRRCQLPADDVACKKLKSENAENKSLQRGRRNRTKELCEEAVSVGGTDRRTRSTTRASARTRK
ncbi:PREDICTED: antigen KI-67 isoform X2 [Calidris pugnax]|uniref:antigen KI-67 isoform X2 n=1 Tax=Calidris pugnax TaxID=198806 RepID=UPI00071E1FF4|nr:PREDICTED: antigen KI-67 isoform X2 [Calidris pugnax]